MKLNVFARFFIMPVMTDEPVNAKKLIKDKLYKTLEQSVEESRNKDRITLIDLTCARGMFKTETLFEFAKDNNYKVIRSLKSRCEVYDFESDKWIAIGEDSETYFKNIDTKILVDEICYYDRLPKSVQKMIIGGYYTPQREETNINILDVLEKESQQLATKIQRTRQEENYGTYKNLIIALKEVLTLIQEIKNTES